MKIIYLDQNHWIYLSQAYYGIDKSLELKEVCDKLINASEEGNVICPLSITHIIETLRHMNKDRRKRLSKFMVKISKGFTILPYTTVIPFEIKNAIYKRLGIEPLDISKTVIGKGIAHSWGKICTIKGDVPEKIRKELLEEFNSPEAIGYFLSELTLAEKSKDRKNDYDLINKIEAIREGERKIKDKDLRYNVCVEKYLSSVLAPMVEKINLDLGLPKDAVISSLTKKQWFDFFKDVPTAYCFFSLSDRVDRNFNRRTDKNDLYDISALAIAIPYCDIVVAESMFSSLAIQARLDKEYETIILSDVKTMNQYL